jgi:hypothetical protein
VIPAKGSRASSLPAGGKAQIPAGGGVIWVSALTTSVRHSAIIERNQFSEEGHTMAWTVAFAFAALAGWTVEWAQRRCEQWAYERDKDL